VTKRINKPLLFLDVDGVISLFGFEPIPGQLPGRLHWVDGVAHCIPAEVGPRISELIESFEVVWATGWEEKANDYLPHILGLEVRELPWLTFDGQAVFGTAHWKLEAIEAYAGDRPSAWVDDSIDDSCRAWADGRQAPTLIVQTDSAVGLTDEHVALLRRWAAAPEAA
jgi:hypothetical protein